MLIIIQIVIMIHMTMAMMIVTSINIIIFALITDLYDILFYMIIVIIIFIIVLLLFYYYISTNVRFVNLCYFSYLP